MLVDEEYTVHEQGREVTKWIGHISFDISQKDGHQFELNFYLQALGETSFTPSFIGIRRTRLPRGAFVKIKEFRPIYIGCHRRDTYRFDVLGLSSFT